MLASLVLITSIGPWGMPQMVQKFYSLKCEKDVTRAMIVATGFALIISFAAYFSGALTHLFYKALPVDPATAKPSADYLMPKLLTEMIPRRASLVILLLVFSASMSSLSSLVLVSSSPSPSTCTPGTPTPSPASPQTMVAAAGALRRLRPGVAGHRAHPAGLHPLPDGDLLGRDRRQLPRPLRLRPLLPWANRAGAIAGMVSGLGTALVLYVLWGEPGVPLAGALGDDRAHGGDARGQLPHPGRIAGPGRAAAVPPPGEEK